MGSIVHLKSPCTRALRSNSRVLARCHSHAWCTLARLRARERKALPLWRNKRALALCTPRECDVRVHECKLRARFTRARFTNERVRTRFTNEGVLRARNECERVTRDSFGLVRLRETRIDARVTCKDFTVDFTSLRTCVGVSVRA